MKKKTTAAKPQDKKPEKPALRRVRCREHFPGRDVLHPETGVPIEVGQVVDLPELLADVLISRGDFVLEASAPAKTEREEG